MEYVVHPALICVQYRVQACIFYLWDFYYFGLLLNDFFQILPNQMGKQIWLCGTWSAAQERYQDCEFIFMVEKRDSGKLFKNLYFSGSDYSVQFDNLTGKSLKLVEYGACCFFVEYKITAAWTVSKVLKTKTKR